MTLTTVRLNVNGAIEEFRAEPRRTLLDALRDDLLLTGTRCATWAIVAPAPCF